MVRWFELYRTKDQREVSERCEKCIYFSILSNGDGTCWAGRDAKIRMGCGGTL